MHTPLHAAPPAPRRLTAAVTRAERLTRPGAGAGGHPAARPGTPVQPLAAPPAPRRLTAAVTRAERLTRPGARAGGHPAARPGTPVQPLAASRSVTAMRALAGLVKCTDC